MSDMTNFDDDVEETIFNAEGRADALRIIGNVILGLAIVAIAVVAAFSPPLGENLTSEEKSDAMVAFVVYAASLIGGGLCFRAIVHGLASLVELSAAQLRHQLRKS